MNDVHHVTLPLPVPINQTYKTGNRRFYKDKLATAWQNDAVMLCRAAGIRPYAQGVYRIIITVDLYCYPQRDLDSGIKILLDALEAALNIPDRYVTALVVRKTPETAHPRMDVKIRVMQ